MFVVRRLRPAVVAILAISKTIFSLLFLSFCLWQTNATSPLDLDPEFALSLTNEIKVQQLALTPDGQIAFAARGTDLSFGWLDFHGTSLLAGTLGGPFQGNALIFTRERAFVVGGQDDTEVLYRFTAERADPYFPQRSQLRGTINQLLTIGSNEDLIAAGAITPTSDNKQYGLVRLQRTGVRDTTFNMAATAGLNFQTAVLTVENRILGSYTSTNTSGDVQWGFGLRADTGIADTNYDASWIPGAAHVALLATDPRGGTFWAALEEGSGESLITHLVELDGFGYPRPGRPPLPLIHGHVRAIGFDSDPVAGGVFLGGDFRQIGETSCNKFAWLSFDGTVGMHFESSSGPNGPVNTIQVQPDGRILIGGDFTQIDQTPANGIARLLGRPATGTTYVYWTDSEFRTYEKSGTVTLTIRRSGLLDGELVLPLSTSDNRELQVPQLIQFAPGEGQKKIVISLSNNSTKENRRRVRFSSFSVPPLPLAYSRSECDLIILDDETSGTRDPQFTSPINYRPTAFATQPDGKTLATYWNNGSSIARLNADGSIDPAFTTNGVPYTNACCSTIYQMIVAPDGKIYAAGSFVSTGSPGVNLVARLNPDGTLDNSFDPTLTPGAPLDPVLIALQPDGKILVAQSRVMRRFQHKGGMFGNQQPLRLNADGTLDATFAPATLLHVNDLTVHLDGSVYVAGDYITTPGNRGIYRLNSKGGIDPDFKVQTDGPVYQIAFDPQGDLIAAGDFTSINGINTAVARIHVPDGTVNPEFLVNLDGQVEHLLLRDDGEIYLAGAFTRINNEDRYRLARLNSDATLDLAFDPGMGFSSPPAIGLQLDGRLLAGAGFADRPTSVDLLPALGIVRLEDSAPGEIQFLNSNRITLAETNSFATIELVRAGGSAGPLIATISLFDPQGSLTTPVWTRTETFDDREFGSRSIQVPLTNSTGQTFFVRAYSSTSSAVIETTVFREHPQPSPLDSSFHLEIVGGANPIRDFDLAPDGSVYLSGDFTAINGFAITNLARLNSDLSLDTNFALAEIPLYTLDGKKPAVLEAIAVRTNGQVVLGGNFQQVGKSNWMNIAQINPDGTYDPAFNRSNIVSGGIKPPKQIVIGPDDKALVTTISDFRRLLPNGALDKSFSNSTLRLPNFLLPDGSVLAGELSSVRRFSSNGVENTSFKVQADVYTNRTTQGGYVSSFALQPDGQILFGGAFSRVNGFENTARIARLSPEGNVDTNFTARIGTNAASGTTSNLVTAIQPLPGGDIVVGGNFRIIEGQPQANLARLSPNGASREYFHPDVNGNRVEEFLLLPSGDILARGSITNIDGVDVGPVFKLHLTEPLPPLVQITLPTNGTTIRISDAVGLMDIRVEAYDPDGFLENTVVYMDDQSITTNTLSAIYVAQYPPLVAGEHKVRAVTTDATGLRSTNEIRFSVEFIPWPFGAQVQIGRSGTEIVLTFDGQLQSSTDLINWNNEPFTSPHNIVLEGRRFYRARK